MKRRMIKQLAGFLAIWLAAESVFAGNVYAQTTNTQSDVEIDGYTISENAISQNWVDVADEDAEIVREESIEAQNEADSDVLINYLYVENERIDTNGTQHIAVEIGQDTTALSDVRLTVKNIRTSETETILAAQIDKNTVVFNKTYDNPNEKSIYQVSDIHYVADGESFQVAFETIGICAFYGVNETVVLSDKPSVDVSAEIVTIDGINASDAPQQIAEALEEGVAAEYANSAQSDVLCVSDAMELSPQGAVLKDVVVVLDPGHDGVHVGARANGICEEVANLKIALACRDELQTYSGVRVYMTRESAACLGQPKATCNFNRVQLAKNVGADVLVSLHLNSSTSATPNGATVYHPNANYNPGVGSKGQTLASAIQAKLAALGLKNNGIQIRNTENYSKYPDGSTADYYDLIKNSKLNGFPGIIVEHAFLSNASEAANYLSSDEKLKKLGIADATGIAQYFGLEKGSPAGKVYVKEADLSKGTFKACIGGIDKNKKIKFKVYPKNKTSLTYTYAATYKDNVYSTVVDVKNHGYTPGTYVITAYEITSSGKEKKLDQAELAFETPKFKDSVVKVAATSSTKQKFNVSATNMEDAKEVYAEVYNNNSPSVTKQTLRLLQKDTVWKATYDTGKYKIGGKYTVNVYAKTCFNTIVKLKTLTFSAPKPKMGKLKLSGQDTSNGTFTMKIPGVKSDAGIKSVKVQVWSLTDKKDSKTYTAKKDANGDYIAVGNIKYHNFNYGTYKTKVTVAGKNGISAVSGTVKIKIKTPVAQVTAKVAASEVSTTITTQNAAAPGGVKALKYEVKRKSDGVKFTYQAKKSGSKWTAKVPTSDLEKSGDYQVKVYALSALNGKTTQIGKTTFTLSKGSAGAIEIKNRQDALGTFDVQVSDVNAKGGVKKVQVSVWNKSDKSDMVVYSAKKSGAGYKATVNIADLGGKAGTYQIKVAVVSKAGVKTTDKRVTKVKMAYEIAVGGYPIMGDTTVTVEQMMAYYKKYATFPAYYASTDAPSLKKFCQLYLTECEAEGVRAEVAFAQAMKETNFLRYGGDVKITQFNFAGLGAVGGGAQGASFASVQIGIRAQVQHLKAYASTQPLKQKCVDARFSLVSRGCAPCVEWLGIKENPQHKGWATDPGYGLDIVKRIQILKSMAQ